ncbi:hypothetical protein SAMN05421788_10120 [Filimonas lacunae]|uniref:Uncharacterized protein n=1 Tax=Filimonas lacunae TaxID=477680 RepID=A0A1N7K627_9BACT|nr:hypothetical protein SAMN05421788_10120 [Filimonas lacunae]
MCVSVKGKLSNIIQKEAMQIDKTVKNNDKTSTIRELK